MFAIFTGTPGAGKTLNLIKYAIEDKAFEGRKVYQYGIKNCRVEGWTNLTFEQFEKWYEFLPNDCVMLVDECQRYWRAGTPTKELPKHLTEIETHRHKGIDILATCQGTAQLHTQAKVLVSMHRHYMRPHGKEGWKSVEYSTAKANPDSESQMKYAVKSSGGFDTNIYDLYDSASLHTQIDRFPRKYIIIGVTLLLAVLIFIPYVIWHVSQFSEAETADSGTNERMSLTDAHARIAERHTEVFDTARVIHLLTPTISNRPDTAPIYESLFEAKDYPREQIIAWTKTEHITCTVYSQQGTKLDIDRKTCSHLLEHGRTFDFRQSPSEQSRAAPTERGTSEESAPQIAPIADRIKVAKYTGSPEFPTRENSYRGLEIR